MHQFPNTRFRVSAIKNAFVEFGSCKNLKWSNYWVLGKKPKPKFQKKLAFLISQTLSKMKLALQSLFLFALCFLILSCEKDEDILASFDCTNIEPTYDLEIKAILNRDCARSGCHSSSSQAGGINLGSYMAAETESSKPRFLGAINQLSDYEAMPRSASKLSDEDIKLITCWVDNGSPEN